MSNSNMLRFLVLTFVASPLCLSAAQADDEASNGPNVAASQYGGCFAKSVPAAISGQEGETSVYRVERGADKLVHTFSWFSQRIFIECNVAKPGTGVGISVVRFGPWNRGRVASETDLALAIYWNGRLTKQYSTLDIAGFENNVQSSVSHYTVVQSVDGFQWKTGNEVTFGITTTDGRKMKFHAATGERER